MDKLNLDWAKIDEIQEDSKGYLHLTGTIAKAGDLIYWNNDGTKRIERVPFETLADLGHLETVVNSDFVLGHPAIINSDNYREYTIGSIGSNVKVNEDNESLELEYTVKDGSVVQRIKTQKLKGLSMAYYVKKEKNEDGTFTQVVGSRSCNHHGLVEAPRCKGAGLNLDGIDSNFLINIDSYSLPEFEFPEIKKNKKLFFIDNKIKIIV